MAVSAQAPATRWPRAWPTPTARSWSSPATAMDIETLVRHRLPVVFVIGNNGIWATEKHPMQALLQTAIATDLSPGIRYDRLVEALGGHGELVTEPGQIGAAFERALKTGVPSCLNVITDPDAAYPRSAALI